MGERELPSLRGLESAISIEMHHVRKNAASNRLRGQRLVLFGGTSLRDGVLVGKRRGEDSALPFFSGKRRDLKKPVAST